ncbi:MAG: tetratricopeptide repeat protein [bacterium]
MRNAGVLICCFLLLSSTYVQAEQTQDHYTKALELADAGEINEAIQELQAAVQDDEADENVYMALGLLSEKSGKDIQALEAFLKAEELDPRMDSVYFALGLLYEKLKLPDKAAESWNTFIALSKNNELKRVAKKHIKFLTEK